MNFEMMMTDRSFNKPVLTDNAITRTNKATIKLTARQNTLGRDLLSGIKEEHTSSDKVQITPTMKSRVTLQ